MKHRLNIGDTPVLVRYTYSHLERKASPWFERITITKLGRKYAWFGDGPADKVALEFTDGDITPFDGRRIYRTIEAFYETRRPEP